MSRCFSRFHRGNINMETFSALLALCVGNSPVTGDFPAQRPVARSFDVFFDLRLNKWLSKQTWGWWFETPSHSLWHHCNGQPQRYIDVTWASWRLKSPATELFVLRLVSVDYRENIETLRYGPYLYHSHPSQRVTYAETYQCHNVNKAMSVMVIIVSRNGTQITDQ